MIVMDALGRFFKRGASGEGNDPMAFLDEYASVMNRYVKIEVHNRFKEGGVDLSLNFGSGDGWLLWLEDGQYCFDEKERGKVRTGGLFNSHSIELTQIVMLNCTVPYLRHALGFSSLSVPSTVDELPVGWSVNKTASACYKSMRGPTGELLEFVTWNPAHCVPLAWFYGVSPSELLHAYMLPYGGPLLRRWLGRPYIR